MIQIPYKTLEEYVAQELRRAIHDGRIQPGQRLVEEEIAAELDVSRTPVRAALRKLEAEGIVTILPHKGAIVAHLSLQEIEETYVIRTALEGLAARYSAERITQAQLEALEQLLHQMEQALANGNLELMLQLNREFHLSMYAAAGMERLRRILGELWDTVEPYRRTYVNLPQRADKALEEHWEIFRALQARDAARVERLTREHLSETATTLTGYLHSKDEKYKKRIRKRVNSSPPAAERSDRAEENE